MGLQEAQRVSVKHHSACKVPMTEPLCPREEWHTSSTLPGRPRRCQHLPGCHCCSVWTACRRWDPRLLEAGQSPCPSPQVGPALELLHGGTLHPLPLASTTAAASQEGTSVPTPEPPSRPTAHINSSKPPLEVCAGAETCPCHTLRSLAGGMALAGSR